VNVLTERQSEILRYVAGYVDDRGYPPSLRDIGRAFEIASTNGVNDHLRALERKGYLRRDPMLSRGMVVVRRPDGTPGDASPSTVKQVVSEAMASLSAADRRDLLMELLQSEMDRVGR
jgi:SOS-response transcriptional repressor LexA